MENRPMILTLSIDELSQHHFNTLRQLYFPKERNHLQAHIMLFHQLPNSTRTIEIIKAIDIQCFELRTSGMLFLGAGVAYKLESIELTYLHNYLSKQFAADLIAQDRQGYRPHITIQNKVTPQAAKKLLQELELRFHTQIIQANGLDIWIYQDGPWDHHSHYPFTLKPEDPQQ